MARSRAVRSPIRQISVLSTTLQKAGLYGELMTETMTTEIVTERTVKRWGLIALLLSLPVAIIVSHFVDSGRGRAAGVSLALMILAIRAFWYLKQRAGFWMTIAALTIIHVVLIVAIPWTSRSIPAPALWPIGIADFAAIYGCVKLAEKLMSRVQQRHQSSRPTIRAGRRQRWPVQRATLLQW